MKNKTSACSSTYHNNQFDKTFQTPLCHIFFQQTFAAGFNYRFPLPTAQEWWATGERPQQRQDTRQQPQQRQAILSTRKTGNWPSAPATTTRYTDLICLREPQTVTSDNSTHQYLQKQHHTLRLFDVPLASKQNCEWHGLTK